MQDWLYAMLLDKARTSDRRLLSHFGKKARNKGLPASRQRASYEEKSLAQV